MKQVTKGGDEWDCKSSARKKGYITARPGFWKSIKRRMNKRHRKEGKQQEHDL
jgi:hypothetical protein